jgi:hypothetical protein
LFGSDAKPVLGIIPVKAMIKRLLGIIFFKYMADTPMIID